MTDIQKRRGLIAVATIMVLAAILRWVPPLAAEYALGSALEKEGFSETTIGELDVNLFTGEVLVNSLSTRHGDGEPVQLANLAIDLEYLPFTSSHIAIESITLDGLLLDARQNADGKLYVANWPLPAPSADTAPVTEDAAPWLFGANNLKVTNSHLSWADGSAKTTVDITAFTLSALRGWTPDTDTPVDLTARINDAPLSLSGTVRPFAANPAATLDLSLQSLDLTAFRGYLDGSGVDLRKAALSIDGIATMTLTGTRPAVDWKGRLSLATPSMAMEKAGFDATLDSLSWDGQVLLNDTLIHRGLLQATNGQFVLPGIPSLSFSAINSDSDVTLSGDDADMIATLAAGLAMVKGDISTQVESLTLSTADRVNIAVDAIRHDMSLNGAAIPDADRQLDIALRKQQDNLRITLTDYDLALLIKAVDVQSDRLAFTKDITSKIGPSSVSGISVQDLKATPEKAQLVSLEKLAITSGNMAADGSVDIRDFNATGLSVLPGDAALAGFKQLAVSRFMVNSAGRAAIGDVSLEGIAANLLRDKEGNLPAIGRLTALADRFTPRDNGAEAVTDHAATNAATQKSTANDTAPITWKENTSNAGSPALTVASFTLSGDNAIHFMDLSVTPDVDLTIDQLAAGFGKPGDKIQALSTKRPVFLKGRVGRGSGIDLSGTAIAGNIFQDLAVQGAIKNIDLYRVSPYVAAFLARNIKGGLLTDNIDLTIKDRQMDMKNGLVVERLDFDALDESQKDAAKDATKLPLELAVSVLSDSDGTIRLDLPVTGAVDSPDFDLSDVISKALGAALAGAAVATLTAFFPPTALLALGGALAIGDGDGGSMTLPAVQFAPASSELTPGAQEVIGAVDAILTSKDGLQLQFCPRAVAADHATILASLTAAEQKRAEEEAATQRQVLIDAKATPEEIDAVRPHPQPVTVDPQQLADLAQARADIVFDSITANDNKHQNRLIGCRPVVDQQDPGSARVDLTL